MTFKLFYLLQLNRFGCEHFDALPLRLVVGMVVTLLRNIRTVTGVCNGTTYILVSVSPQLLELKAIATARRLLIP